jgi:NADH:ubiquinone oxidoreductase subunit 3 (subunit A)
MKTLLYHPGVVFALCFLCTWIIYLIGRSISAAGSPSAGKGKVYGCGEDIEACVAPSYNWFHIAFVFTLLDIAVLMVATMPSSVNLTLGVTWVVAGGFAIAALLTDR